MMKINLNDETFTDNSVKIFNNGIAGKVNNVTISVLKKEKTETGNTPDYKLLITDEHEANINQAFYYYKDNPLNDDEKNKKSQQFFIRRLVSLIKIVMGEDFKLPEVNSLDEVLDFTMETINNNSDDKKFNVFVNYGTTNRPSKYLGLRFFDYIEKSDTEPNNSNLKLKNNDLMTELIEDTSFKNLEQNSNSGTWGV